VKSTVRRYTGYSKEEKYRVVGGKGRFRVEKVVAKLEDEET